MTDAELARRVIAGEEAAFDEFFERYFPRLFRFAAARLGQHANAAEDVVQRVLIHGISRLHTYKGEAALLTWLCTLCRHEISATVGKQGREVSWFDDDADLRAIADAVAVADQADPEQQLLRQEVSALVQTALDHLPEHYGEVLEWKYLQDVPVQQIAERRGISGKAAESLLTRARVAFRESFLMVSASSRRYE